MFTQLRAQNPGDALFSSSSVHEINIVLLQPSWWDSLVAYKAQSDQLGTDIYMKGQVIIDGTPVDCVGVKLKGNASYNHPGQKKSIKIKFNEYVQGRDYDNLKSFHLNNSAYDPTMVREKIFLDFLNDQGIPAPRCTYARVSYNGQYVGLFKIIEPVDKTFLQTHFGDDRGNLYKGDPNGTLEWQGAGQSAYQDDYELKTNEALNDWSSLINFIGVINNSGNDFYSNLEANFNTGQYIRAWAANNLFVNLDSYLQLAHNYYIVHDSLSNKMQWITWDVSLVFGAFPSWLANKPSETDLLFLPDPPSSRPLNNNMLKVQSYRDEYFKTICSYLSNDFRPSVIFPKIDSLANVIRPHVYAEPDANQMFTEAEFEGNLNQTSVSSFLLSEVSGLKKFINERRTDVYRQLCEKEWSCHLGKSVKDVDFSSINIFPNPASDVIRIQFPLVPENLIVSYAIYDSNGNKVIARIYQHNTEADFIDISTVNLSTGVYHMVVDGGCMSTTKSFLIIR